METGVHAAGLKQHRAKLTMASTMPPTMASTMPPTMAATTPRAMASTTLPTTLPTMPPY